jgi:hypothetical protein
MYIYIIYIYIHDECGVMAEARLLGPLASLHLSVCVNTCVCMYIRVYVVLAASVRLTPGAEGQLSRPPVAVNVSAYVSMCVCMRTEGVHSDASIVAATSSCGCSCMYICMRVRTYFANVRMYIHIHIHKRKHAHTYVNTYTKTCKQTGTSELSPRGLLPPRLFHKPSVPTTMMSSGSSSTHETDGPGMMPAYCIYVCMNWYAYVNKKSHPTMYVCVYV